MCKNWSYPSRILHIIQVTGPIGVVFTPDAMTQYLMLFNTLWRAKRMEWVLSGVWQKLASLHKMTRYLGLSSLLTLLTRCIGTW